MYLWIKIFIFRVEILLNKGFCLKKKKIWLFLDLEIDERFVVLLKLISDIFMKVRLKDCVCRRYFSRK